MHNEAVRNFGLLLLSLLIVGACQTQPPPAPVRPSGTVLAKLDEFEVTESDLQQLVEEIEAKTPKVIQTFQQKKELLEQLINVQLLYEVALEQGFDESFRFKSKLVDSFIESLEEKEAARIDEYMIDRHYRENRDKYDEISARHILLRVTPQTTREERLEMIRRLEGWREIARNAPERFQELARQYSQDATARGGGELGFFVRATMVAPFARAAFALKEIGDVSEVVQTEFGYHIIQLSGDRRGLEFHEDAIRRELTRRTKSQRLNQILSDARQGREIRIFEKEILELLELPEEMRQDPELVLPEDFDERRSSHED
ncbi:MAG: hypothetical protein EA369_05370 [Bradymonadales bacterium]|nr:MAG: hypothetical protein EA369_05370 [Bradymonadales bacterium]